MTFDYPLLILERHLDTYGHVNNSTYLEIFEEARWDFIEKGGYGHRRIMELGQGPIVLEVNLKFMKAQKLLLARLSSKETRSLKILWSSTKSILLSVIS